MIPLLRFVVFAVVVHQSLAVYKNLTIDEAARLQAWTEDSEQKMWELSGQVEGDMLLTPNQRNGVINTRLRWPNRVIPYEIDSSFTAAQVAAIDRGAAEFARRTCVTVRRRRAGENDFVRVTGANSGCWSWVGRTGGRQDLNLQRNGCVWHDIIVHEFLHAAGFYHEQSRTDRDNYVTILWNNIQRGMEHNFDRLGANVITGFGQPYDYGSILHYSAFAFSANGQRTIQTRVPNVVIGQAPEMSAIDARKLNLMYNC